MSALEEFLNDFRADIARLKTDLFHDCVAYTPALQQKIGNARASKQLAPLVAIEEAIDFKNVDGAALVDLMLGYRGVEAWQRMLDLIAKMPQALAHSVLVQEQYALALNRLDKGSAQAEEVLRELIAKHGPSSETNSLLGRIYKDRGALDAAIEAYASGFEADRRDAFPGINAVTLMELREPPDERRHDLLPAVRLAATTRAESAKADYWDWATLLELAVLARDREGALAALQKALSLIREQWEPKSTLGNLQRIDRARTARGEERAEWLAQILAALG